MLFITKCSTYLSFISRYSQVFNVVSSCHAADVPSVSDFVPNPMNHVRMYGLQPLLLSVPVVLPNLQEEVEQKLWLLTYPHTENPRGVKSGDRGGQAIVPPRPIQATVCRVTRGNHFEHLSISVDKTSTYTAFCDIYHSTVSFRLSVLVHLSVV